MEIDAIKDQLDSKVKQLRDVSIHSSDTISREEAEELKAERDHFKS